MALANFIYRHRLLGKRLIAMLSRILPRTISSRLRSLAEHIAFSFTPQYQAETLPPIFSYWSSHYLSIEAKKVGVDSPESFYLKYIQSTNTQHSSGIRILSVGTGAASMEIALSQQLQSLGIEAQFICMDFNSRLMHLASDAARALNLSDRIKFQVQDCNLPFVEMEQDIIIVNQFFHHVTELEVFCNSLKLSLTPQGTILTSDIIGRNGHQLWPDVEIKVQDMWKTMSPRQRHDRYDDSIRSHYRMVNHAAYSNEGIRAQDVVGCLLADFDFELFFTFGAAIVPFIERRIGFNFDSKIDADREIIDRIQAIDAYALANGLYPASNMIAALRHKGHSDNAVHYPISPQLHVELTCQQIAKLNS